MKSNKFHLLIRILLLISLLVFVIIGMQALKNPESNSRGALEMFFGPPAKQ